jgi:hypothetical protein
MGRHWLTSRNWIILKDRSLAAIGSNDLRQAPNYGAPYTLFQTIPMGTDRSPFSLATAGAVG